MKTREIKFKVWDVTNEKMIHNAIELKNGSILERVKLEERTSDNVIWLQSLGVKDCSGNYIYEGDIVTYKETLKNYDDDDYHLENRFSSQYYEQVYRSEVKYCDSRAVFFIYFHVNNWNQVKIIGNIYENPELRK